MQRGANLNRHCDYTVGALSKYCVDCRLMSELRYTFVYCTRFAASERSIAVLSSVIYPVSNAKCGTLGIQQMGAALLQQYNYIADLETLRRYVLVNRIGYDINNL